MARVPTLAPRFGSLDARAAKPAPKTVDPFYQSAEHLDWRELVIARAGRRCEYVHSNGRRCEKAEPADRMFADHVVERRDGGAPLDPRNGKCLCGQHHTLKTLNERAKRLAASGGGRGAEISG